MTTSSMKFLATLLAVTLLPASGSFAGRGDVDASVTLDTLQSTGFYIFLTTDSSIGPTGEANLNPTMVLEVGKRYEITNARPTQHPFAMIAGDAENNPIDDTRVLVNGATVGNMESDPGVAFSETSSAITFTVTTGLIEALQGDSQQSPGYRCEIHSSFMRGDLAFVGPAAEAIADFVAGVGEQPSSADLNGDGAIDAADAIKSARLF